MKKDNNTIYVSKEPPEVEYHVDMYEYHFVLTAGMRVRRVKKEYKFYEPNVRQAEYARFIRTLIEGLKNHLQQYEEECKELYSSIYNR